MLIEDLDTPVVTVDLDAVSRNIERAATYFAAHGIALRPHIKTHKIVAFARDQVAHGAVGITCQKLGEAAVMAHGGLTDVLLTFPIVGDAKLRRLGELSRSVTLAVVCDSVVVADGLAAAFATGPHRLPVFVECDVGAARCGVQDPAEALALAKHIARSPGIHFGGLMTYPPVGRIAQTRAWLGECLAQLDAAGLPAPSVSVGGTPEMFRAHEIGVSTEHRPGTYIYSDRMMVGHGVGATEDCALRIVATVVSRPTADRAIIDAGSKTLSSDTGGFPDFGVIVDYPSARIVKLSEEHGHVDLAQSAEKPAIGERLTIIPNHACVVSNLANEVAAVADGRLVRMIPVDARGLTS